ncbi:hypothetical protein Kpol_1020p35 [Vanderwaltozyma polyspora DSM 70294]|uniref:DNA mismatch repair protein PMS1 n=1 Tax=Vanderwaltozyma polyspora (strain ATCC 22028 / DSM 70294 / BCRC 21397 / CBS 2163 / NBRC 10782 / NRRL Y-8283 / UCD 57-17) TaxID=436907 RepID=A7TLE5_VANPO|nr:uncharacterized protein Kpol_1020p35 [Vanderwaltozyma polyspora DSM 70294]EDO16926.1 hypothetical protein Kpol_1020p35 [Vanderwaltozyma polyspora DSM 70294]
MSKIASLGKSDVHRITSGQVIIDLTTAVKELIDNSIDASAKQIDITLKNYGIDSIECSDDGVGISVDNYESLALKHYTSKISNFEDVSSVQTLGFRGEALSSLCAISKVSVVTTTKAPRADRLEYDMHGTLIGKSTTTRNKGTAVIVSQLFNNLPVRRKEFIKTSKRHFTKCINLIQSYAIIQNDVKFTVWHVTPSGKKQQILSTLRNNSIQKNILSIFGSNSLHGLSDIDAEIDLNPYKPSFGNKYVMDTGFEQLDYKIRAKGLISKNSFGCGRTSKDRQYVYINKRPIEYSLINKCCNEIYRQYNNVQYPAFFIDFEISSELIDINITPDKRTILFHNERYVIDVFKEELIKYYDKQEFSLPKQSRIKSSEDEIRLKLESQVQNIQSIKKVEPDIINESEGHKSLEIDMPFDDDTKLSTQDSLNDGQSETNKLDNDEFISQSSLVQNKEDESDSSEKILEYTQKSSSGRKRRLSDDYEELETSRSDKSESTGRLHENSGEVKNIDSAVELINSDNDFSNDEVSDVTIEKGSVVTNKRTDSYRPSKRTNIASNLALDSFINPHFEESTLLNNSQTFQRNDVESEDVLVEIEGETEQHKAALFDEKLHFISDEPMDKTEVAIITDSNNSLEEGCHSKENDECCSESDSILDIQLAPEELNIRTPISYSWGGGKVKYSYRSLTDSTANSELDAPIVETSLDVEPLNRLIEELSVIGNLITSNHDNSHNNEETRNYKIEDIEEGEKYLTLTVNKDDFNRMEIVGQFNLGFIIATRKVGDKYDLFIIDQHASDEKYNFETLQKSTVFKSQKLIVPQPVELSVIDELLVIENIGIFEKNGFKIEVDEDDTQGNKIKLVSLPVSKRTLFDINDFMELLHLIKNNVGIIKSDIKCTKIRSMFAMRACRTSIMIGKPLTKKTMSKVVKHLSELHKPWNCPHGRPTMRHLMELKQWDNFIDDYSI